MCAYVPEISISNHAHHFTFELLYVGLSYCLAFKVLNDSGYVEMSLNIGVTTYL